MSAQEDRWKRLLSKWETALTEGKEVISVMDANLDAMTWRNEPHTQPRHSTSRTHTALIDALFDRILPMGVEMMTPTTPTWARGEKKSCLDHVYTTAPSKLSPVETIWTGMSDHALIKFGRFTKEMQAQQAYIKKRMFKNFQHNQFKLRISQLPELQRILKCLDVKIAANLLTKGLTRILDDMAPIKTIQTRKNYAPHIEDNTKALQTRRNQAQEIAVMTGNPEDWRNYRALRNQTTASLRKDLVAYTKDKLCSKDNSPADI